MALAIDPQDIVGRRYGHLVVDAFLKCELVTYKCRTKPFRKYYYQCVCDCGGGKIVGRDLIVSFRTTSCGCQWHPLGSINPRWVGHGEISGTHWNAITMGAKARDFTFTITIEDAWAKFTAQGRRCALTGVPLDFGGVRDPGRTASLDRIDSSKGYVPGNIQWVSKPINRMKWDLGEDEFISLCQAVANYATNLRSAAE